MLTAILLLCLLFPAAIAAAQTPDAGRQVVRQPLRRLPRQRRQRRRARSGHRDARAVANRRGAGALFRQGLPAAGMPAFPNLTGAESRRADPLPAHVAAATGSGPLRTTAHAERRRRASKDSSSIRARSTCNCWATTARFTCCARAASSIGRHVAGRLAQLQRPDQRQPLQPARADHDEQRGPHRAQVDLQPAQHVAPAGDAGRRRTA